MSSHRFSVIRRSEARLDASAIRGVHELVAQFPGARWCEGSKWRIESPREGTVEVSVSAGRVSLENHGSTNLVMSLFVQFQRIIADVIFEETVTGTWHDRDSLSEWVHVDEDGFAIAS